MAEKGVEVNYVRTMIEIPAFVSPLMKERYPGLLIRYQ